MKSYVTGEIDTERGKLAYMEWVPEGVDHAPVVIGLHGWLDNAASFIPMAEYLNNVHLIVPDLPGHGLSDHHELPGFYQVQDYVVTLMMFLDQLGFERVSVLGHSLGSIISGLWTLTDPRIQNLMWIDAIGGLSREESETAKIFTEAVHALSRFTSRKPTYSEFDQAVEARMSGLLPVNRQSSELLCQRGVHQVDGRWTWRNDKALMLPTPLRLNEKAICNLLSAISVPVRLFVAQGGWLAEDQVMLKRRIAAVPNIRSEFIEGGHHSHMEEQAEYLARCLEQECTE